MALWLWGQHAVKAALNNPHRSIEAVYTTEPISFSRKCRVHRVSSAELRRMLPPGAVHQGLAAEVHGLASLSLESIEEGPLLVLDQVTDPHNVGALWRSAAAFGVKGVLLTKHHSPALEGVLAKAASGGLEHVPAVLVSNIATALQSLKRKGFFCYGVCETGSSLTNLISKDRMVLVMGAEGKGLRSLTKASCDAMLRIPTCSHFSTLNVSAAGAVILYAVLAE